MKLKNLHQNHTGLNNKTSQPKTKKKINTSLMRKNSKEDRVDICQMKKNKKRKMDASLFPHQEVSKKDDEVRTKKVNAPPPIIVDGIKNKNSKQ